MANILVRLTVEDYAKWRAVFDEVSELRRKAGSQGGMLFRKSESPDEVTILFDWPDLEKGRGYFQSDVLRQAMQRAGVIGRPDVTYLDTVDKISA